MFSHPDRPVPPRPCARSGLRRGGPILVREVLPAALALLHTAPDAEGPSRAPERPEHPRTPPLPRAA